MLGCSAYPYWPRAASVLRNGTKQEKHGGPWVLAQNLVGILLALAYHLRHSSSQLEASIHSLIPHAARVRAERCPAKTACAHIPKREKIEPKAL